MKREDRRKEYMMVGIVSKDVTCLHLDKDSKMIHSKLMRFIRDYRSASDVS